MIHREFFLRLAAFFGACTAAAAGGTACAQDVGASPATDSDTTRLEEITVTAQRRTENLQDVPIAISVVKGDDLQKTGFQQVFDLQYMVPSLQYDPTNGGAFQIRGVGTESFDFSNEQSVSVVVDDVVMDGQRDPGLTGLADIQQVSVLRGPQGTLFGRNATSGVVSITTNKPLLGQWSGTVTANYGERNDRNATATFNVPLGNALALRVSAFEQGQNGYGSYTDLKNDGLNSELGTFREAGVRAKLLFEPIDSLDVLLIADYANHWDNQAQTLASAVPTITAAAARYGAPVGPDNINNADPYPSFTRTKSYGGSLQINYRVAGQTLTSVTAYRRTGQVGDGAFDFVPDPLFVPVNDDLIATKKISEELRLASPTGQFVEYVLGLYYNRLQLYSTQLQWGQVAQPLPPGVLLALSGGAGTDTNEAVFNTVNESKAAFGQIKLNFTDNLSLALGARVTHDDNSQAFHYAKVPTSYFLIPIFPTPNPTTGEATHHNLSYRIAPEYKITPDVTAYVTYSTGYKAPGVAFVDGVYDPYKAETVKAYEAGAKTELFDRRLRLNADVFYSKYSNFQAQTLVPQPVGPSVFVIGNAGGLKSEGLEADLTFQANASLSVNGGLTYAESSFTNYIDGPNNYTGDNLTNAPRWAATIGGNFKHSVGGGYSLTANANYSYRTKVFTVIAQDYSMVPGYGILGGRVGITPEHGPWQVGFYARNLLDKHFATGYGDAAGLGIYRSTSLNAFRTVGLYANYSF